MDNIIALRPEQYQLIEIQTTLVLGNDKTYLNTVNIMFDNIIIEKIRVADKHILNNEKNINQITRRYFSDKLKPKKNTKINKEKKKKAVSNLMDELNLN